MKTIIAVIAITAGVASFAGGNATDVVSNASDTRAQQIEQAIGL